MADYLHPHDTYVMRDNTVLTESTTANTGSVLFQPFFSERGIDGKIIDLKDFNTVFSDYGEPNLNLYGQSYYQVLNWLENGGVVKGIRLTAKNATFANAILMLNIKIVDIQKVNASNEPLYKDALTGQETTIASGNTPIMLKKANVKHTLETFTNIAQNDTDTKTLLRSKMTTDENGIHIPLFCMVCRGKGSYGKMYRFRLTPAIQRDKETTYRNYNFEILKNESGLTKVKNTPVNISTFPTAKNIARQSEFIEDVINRQGFPIKVIAIEDAFYTAANNLLPVIQQQYPNITDQELDIYTFYDTKQSKYQNVEVLTGSLDLTSLEGHGLDSGSDGDFATSNPTRWDAMYERLADLFKGQVDESIVDVREHKFKLTLDANFPLEVKKLMVSWRNRRDDAPLVLDSTIMYTKANLTAFLAEELKIDSFGNWVEVNNFDVYDKYTGKNITVTSTYLWSILLIRHLINRGSHVPFAGIDIPLNEFIIEGSLRPTISEPADKSEIYELRGNYIEKENGYYTFGTNITSQVKKSELLYTNNVFVYYEIKEALQSLSGMFRFKFSDSDEDFKTLNKIATQKVEPFTYGKCKVIKVNVSKSDSDPDGKTVKTLCSVGFNDFNLNNDIEVDIDRY